jgi:hypothetical protein
MNNITLKRGGAIVMAALVLTLVLSWALRTSTPSATADDQTPGPTTAVTAAEVNTFSALRKAPLSTVPAALQRWQAEAPAARQYGANVNLSRAISPPNGEHGALYLVPGSEGVCLYIEGTAAPCQTLEGVANNGGIYVQMIPPNNASDVSPLPPPSSAVKSTIVGVASATARTIDGVSTGGARIHAQTAADGAFSVSGTDLRDLAITSTTGATTRGALVHR